MGKTNGENGKDTFWKVWLFMRSSSAQLCANIIKYYVKIYKVTEVYREFDFKRIFLAFLKLK